MDRVSAPRFGGAFEALVQAAQVLPYLLQLGAQPTDFLAHAFGQLRSRCSRPVQEIFPRPLEPLGQFVQAGRVEVLNGCLQVMPPRIRSRGRGRRRGGSDRSGTRRAPTQLGRLPVQLLEALLEFPRLFAPAFGARALEPGGQFRAFAAQLAEAFLVRGDSGLAPGLALATRFGAAQLGRLRAFFFFRAFEALAGRGRGRFGFAGPGGEQRTARGGQQGAKQDFFHGVLSFGSRLSRTDRGQSQMPGPGAWAGRANDKVGASPGRVAPVSNRR